MTGNNRRRSIGRDFDKWKKKGFTTVELIIVIVMVMVLAGGLIFGVSYWITKINFDRQNEYARALYAAAQNQLTEYSTSGQMESLRSALQDNRGDYKSEYIIDVSTLTGADGQKYNLDKLWPESVKSGGASGELSETEKTRYRDTVCYLKGTPADYEKYLQSKKAGGSSGGSSGGSASGAPSDTSVDSGIRVLYTMLESYLYDTDILKKGVVCVEFTPGDGQVFAVLYSDKAEDFTYEENDNRSGTVSISSREVGYRKARMVGYYGVDTLYKSTSTRLEKPTINSLKLNNEDTLNLSFQIGKVTAAETQLKYEIIVYDNKTKNERLSFVLDGSQLKNKDARQNIECEVTRYLHVTDEEGKLTTVKQYLGTYNVLAWMEGTGTTLIHTVSHPVIRIVLDAADTKATTFLYASAHSDLTTTDPLEKGGTGTNPFETSGFYLSQNVTDLKKTLSFRRFGLEDVEDIFCSVRATGENYKPAAKKTSNAENAYFGSWKSSTSGTTVTDTYTIRNGRHLYNIRYLEDHTIEALNAQAQPESGERKTVYQISEEWDWSEYASASLFENGAEAAHTSGSPAVDQDGVFPSIQQLRAASTLESRNGQTIRGLRITAAGNRQSEVYKKYTATARVSDQNEIRNGEANEANQSAGLFLVNYGTIQKTALDQIQVTGGTNVGAFCGVNKGKLHDLTVKNTAASGTGGSDRTSRIQGIKNVGGIAGTHAFVSDASETSVLTGKSVALAGLANYAEVAERSEPHVSGENSGTGSIYTGTADRVGGADAADVVSAALAANAARQGFGGIFGSLHTAGEEHITLENAKNYGKVYVQDQHEYQSAGNASGQNAGQTETETLGVGGIAGITRAYTRPAGQAGSAGDTVGITLKQCISSPQYTSAEVSGILQSESTLDQALKGKYVGGIVGYNEGGNLYECSTQKQSSTKEGYLFGKEYVGGIVGYNASVSGNSGSGTTGSGESADNAQIAGAVNGSRNQAHVIGASYVGGIVGGNPSGTLENWINEGFIGATTNFAGGITGYNGSLPSENERVSGEAPASILNCSSSVANSNAVSVLRRQSGLLKADFVGGIAGYNDGTIRADKTVSIVSNVTGKNYVGGVVGYNDVDAIVENYSVTGGYVEASGCYVGGYCGMNASHCLLVDADYKPFYIESNPNLVKGYACVGGIIGGNIVPATRDISCGFLTDNFLGELEAEGAFAGGFIGYNRLVTYDPNAQKAGRATSNTTRAAIMSSVVNSVTEMEKCRTAAANTSGDAAIRLEEMADTTTIFQKTTSRYLHDSSYRITLTGKESGNATQARFGGITAQIYAGGVVGYNDSTKLLIQNVENKTPVTALASVPDAAGASDVGSEAGNGSGTGTSGIYQTTDYNNKTKTYSYAGGIIGIVTPEVTLENCRNQDSGAVISKGTYTGGLCEINEGVISQCRAASLGSSGKDYVGGIVGVNKAGGKIYNCQLSNRRTITGRNYVGGIAAENYGMIQNVSINGSIRAYGTTGYVGGVTGYNHPGAQIEMSGAALAGTSDSTYVTVQLLSYGNYAGGIVGYNEGTVAESGQGTAGKVVVTGSVTGADSVGGIIGANEVTGGAGNNARAICNFTNQASVTATGKAASAGGIAGKTTGAIRDCINTGVVSAHAQGAYAGGIVAQNSSRIEGCTDTGSVNASNGLCGGITAVNKSGATIQSCTVASSNNLRSLTFTGNQMAGGVCAQNSGAIIQTDVRGVVLYDLAESSGSMLGGIAAMNRPNASITDCAVSDTSVISRSSGGSHGGVAGVNLGTIEGGRAGSGQTAVSANAAEHAEPAVISDGQSADARTSVQADIRFTEHDMTYFGNLGGIAGKNAGLICGYRFSGTVTGTANNPQNPPQYDPTKDEETSGAVIYGYGGIAGINGSADRGDSASGGMDAGSGDSVTGDTTAGSGDSVTGDTTAGSGDGMNTGTIADCEVTAATIIGSGDATNVANIGGIAGVNEKGSVISGTLIGMEYRVSGENQTAANPSANVLHAANAAVAGINKTYSVYVGTVGNTSAYGHTGGIAGMNAGAIEGTGAYADGTAAEKDALTGSADGAGSAGMDQAEWSAPAYENLKSTSVLVENTRGHVGGIAGYNRRTGMITEASTGAGWVVFAPQNASDNGCGGIIGYQAGERGLRRCTNAATVIKTVSGSNGAGGMVGRMEVATARNYLIQDCTNYGNIYGYERVGGMIGVAKYYGGTLSGCVNYGKITANGGIVGGMVGHLYGISKDYGAVYMTSCINHGTISGKNSGGILGYSTQAAALILISDCVNTGLVYGSGRGGIIGSTGYIDADSRILNCRNYGYAFGGATGMGGISATENSALKIEQCFGVAGLEYPIASNVKNGAANYYISGSQSEQTTTFDGNGQASANAGKPDFYVKSISAPTYISGSEYLYKIVSGTTAGDLGDSNAYFSNAAQDWYYEFTFSRDIELSKISLYWNRAANQRWYKYKIYYSKYTSGEIANIYKEVENTKESGRINTAEVIQPKDGNVTARRIRIVITEAHGNNTSGASLKEVNAALVRANFTGTCDGQPVENFHQLQFKSTNNYVLSSGLENLTYSKGNPVNFTGMPYETSVAVSGGSVKGVGTAASAVLSGSAVGSGKSYHLESQGAQVGLSGFAIDPYSALNNNENNPYKDEKLSAVGTGNNNIRYQVYEAVDPYLVVKTVAPDTSLALPSNVRLTGTSGGVTASWSVVNDALRYEYIAEYYVGDERVETRSDIVYQTEIELPVSDINGKKVTKIIFRVRAAAAALTGSGAEQKPGFIYSKYTEPAEYSITGTLPVPEYHFELVKDDRQLKYQVILDNREDYEGFLGENGIAKNEFDTYLDKIQITVKMGTTPASFTVKQGRLTTSWQGRDGNVMFTATAKDNGTGKAFSTSAQSLRESIALLPRTYDNAAKIANVYLSGSDGRAGVGFHGDTADTLNYLVKLYHVGTSYAFYMRTELTAVDGILDVPVSLSSSEVRISNVMASDIATALTSLPTDLMDPERYSGYMVRSYPTLMTNNVVYNGHDVRLPEALTNGAEGVTADMLKQLYVTADKQVTTDPDQPTGEKLITPAEGNNTSAKLAAGYVIRLNQDGTYSLYYNTLLDYNDTVKNGQYQSETDKTAMLTQVYYYKIPSSVFDNRQPKPTISVNPLVKPDGSYETETVDGVTTIKEGDPNTDTMIIVWDQKTINNEAYKIGAEYDYTITGITDSGDGSAGEQVLIETGRYKTADKTGITEVNGEKTGPNRLVLDASAWKYRQVNISISRRGTTDKNDVTQMFPNGSIREVLLKTRFSQIEGPVTELHIENGVAQKNALGYDVRWGQVPLTERQTVQTTETSAMNTDLAAYEITVRRNAEEDQAAVLKFSTEDEYKNKLEELKKLYDEKAGLTSAGASQVVEETITDENGNQITTLTWKWSESAPVEETAADPAGTITKTMVLTLEKVKTGSAADGTTNGATGDSADTAAGEQWMITKELTAVWHYPVSTETAVSQEQTELTRTVDLSDFDRGEALHISVRAVAKQDQPPAYISVYRDGPEGVITEMTLPSRLDVPDVKYLSYSKEKDQYQADRFITIQEIEAGLEVTYQPEGTVSEDVNGAYDLAIAVYDALPMASGEQILPEENAVKVAEEDTSRVRAGDEPAGGETTGDTGGSTEGTAGDPDENPSEPATGSYWNTGARATIAGKSNPMQMDGNLMNATALVENLRKEYGGRWLKIAMRSISESNISSWWSDEDEAAAETQNYRWIRIPRVQEKTPDVNMNTSLEYYDFDSAAGKYIHVQDQGTTSITIEQTTAEFSVTELADHYQIEWIRQPQRPDLQDTAQAAGEGVTVSDMIAAGITADDAIRCTDWLYLERAENVSGADNEMGAYHVFYATTDPGYNPDARRKELKELLEKAKAQGNNPVIPESEICENAVYLGTIGDAGSIAGEALPEKIGTSILLPYKAEVSFMQDADPSIAETISMLRYSRVDEKVSFTLMLPDVEKISSDRYDGEAFTEQISVTGIIDENSKAYYEDSRICHQYKTNTQDEWQQKEIEKKIDAPGVTMTISPIQPAVSDGQSSEDVSVGGASVYKLQIENAGERLTLEVILKDQNNNKLLARYVSCYSNDIGNNMNNIAVLPIGHWLKQAGYEDQTETMSVSLEIRAIAVRRVLSSDPMSGGLSKWGLPVSFDQINVRIPADHDDPAPNVEENVSRSGGERNLSADADGSILGEAADKENGSVSGEPSDKESDGASGERSDKESGRIPGEPSGEEGGSSSGNEAGDKPE